MKYQDLIGQINADINTNGNHAITGAKMNSVLNEMVSVLGDGFRIAGEVYPSSESPTDPENGMCYIAATSGSYVNFGNIGVNDDEIALIYYDSDNESWNKMRWSRKDFGLVVVDASTLSSFGEDEMTEVRKSICFIIRNDALDVPNRLFVKDRLSNGFIWFYAAPMLSSDSAGDLVLDQGCIQIRSTAEGGRCPYETVSISYKLPTKGNVNHALSLKQDVLSFDPTPTAGSTNPVTSEGIKNYVDSNEGVTDVTVGGVSVVTQGVAAVPAIPDTTNFIQKSNTVGLVKNDGTIDTTSYGTYSKPAGGIPETDLATAVQTSLGLADTALQSYTETDPVFSASAAAGITSSDISDWNGKADPTRVVDVATMPASMEPNKVYRFGTLSGDTRFPDFSPAGNAVANVWCWTFTTPSTAPTITWPVDIIAWAGGSAPTINASKSYEVSVMDRLALIVEY